MRASRRGFRKRRERETVKIGAKNTIDEKNLEKNLEKCSMQSKAQIDYITTLSQRFKRNLPPSPKKWKKKREKKITICIECREK